MSEQENPASVAARLYRYCKREYDCPHPSADDVEEALAAAEERGRRAGSEERDRLIAALREVERMTSVGPPSRPGGPITAGSGWYSTLLSVNAYVHGALAPRDSGKEG